MMIHDSRPRIAGNLLACICAILALTHAVEGVAQVLEEIVVTAQKREQAVQDVGIALTAFSGNQIDSLGFEKGTDVVNMTAGIYVSGASAGQDAQFSIRGVTQNDFNDAIEGPNSVYVDEGYVAAQNGQAFGLFDLERVEVLKGPQGTTFGRNATGGLVHFVTRKPTRAVEGFADVQYGSYDQVRFEGSVSGPLSGTLAGRLSAMYNRHDEILNNRYPLGATVPGTPGGGQDIWNENIWGIRGQFLWEPSERVSLLVSAYGSQQEISEAAYQSVGTIAVLDAQGRHVNTIFAAPAGVCEAISAETGGCVPLVAIDGELPGVPGVPAEDAVRPVPGGDLFGYVDPDGDGRDTSKDFAFDDISEYGSYGTTAKLTWGFDRATLTSVSHYMHFDREHPLDVDASPMPQSLFQAESDSDSFTQELRLNGDLDRVRWLAGLYFLYIDTQHTLGLAFPANSPFSTIIFGTPVEVNNIVDLETQSYSLFGQVDVDLTDTLTLVAGLRTIIEKKDYSFEQLFFPNTDDTRIETDQPPLFPGAPPFADDTEDTLWAGKLQMEYRPNEDWLMYAGINRGVKAGSFNAKLNDGTPNLAPEDIPYVEEVLTAYEIGFKSTLFEGSTRLNGSFYYYDYKDYQAFVFTQSSGFVRNTDARYRGVELEVITNPLAGLDVMLNASWIDADVYDLEVAPALFRDVTPSFTPSVQVAGLVRYEWPSPFGDGRLAAQMDGHYVSSFYHNIRNFQAQELPSYVIGNARLTWISPGETWEGSVFVNNIADKRYRTMGFDLSTLCGCNQESYGKPRWFGASIRYSF
jgi:iron complex outermembrane receptor protein